MEATSSLASIPAVSYDISVGTLAIAVLGWLVALWLQGTNIRHQHRVNVRYEIYKQLVSLHKQIQDSTSQLSAKSRSPFIQMESSMIAFNIGLKKEFKGDWIPYSEAECIFEGEQKWMKFISSLFDSHFDYMKNYLSFMYVLEDWSAAVKPLLNTKEVFNEEINRVQREIYNDLSYLQSYSGKHGHDWRTWDKNEINKILDRVSFNANMISCYLSDFVTLLHNELLSEYFGYSRPIRKTLDPTLKVLTKEGFVVSLEDDYEEKLRKLKGGGN